MSKLLRADFNRLFKSKFFWISSAFMALLGLILPIDRYFCNKEAIALGHPEYAWPLEDGFFNYVIALFFIITIMTALFVGAGYACGTIRNKIVVGQKRTSIYFSNLITLSTAVVIWTLIYIVANLAVGIPLLGMFKCKFSVIISLCLLALALAIAITAIMLLVAMLCQNRTYSAITCLMVVLALIISGIIVNSKLEEPQYYDSYTILNTETGETMHEDKQPNPNYVSGTKRLVLEEALDIIPGGQMIQICGMTADNISKSALYDLAIIILTTGIGVFFFRRKDLK